MFVGFKCCKSCAEGQVVCETIPASRSQEDSLRKLCSSDQIIRHTTPNKHDGHTLWPRFNLRVGKFVCKAYGNRSSINPTHRFYLPVLRCPKPSSAHEPPSGLVQLPVVYVIWNQFVNRLPARGIPKWKGFSPDRLLPFVAHSHWRMSTGGKSSLLSIK